MFPPALKERYLEPSLDLPWEQDVVALRRDFHIYPELGYEETRTAGIVAARLRALGIEVREGVGVTGVVGTLRGGKPGPTVLVRADMDALPVEEDNDWEWKSSVAGKMHACGHDAHTAIGLTVARLLAAEREELAGNVVFMFQPAEEGLGGASRMIADGLLDTLPDYALALHVWSELEAGTVAVSPGPVMASADFFKARIIGKGGHGAIPQQTIDPIAVAAHLITALQTVVSRNLAPLSPGVVTIGKVWAGSSPNIIPNEAILEGTVRAFDETVRATLERRCREIVLELPLAFGAKSEFEYQVGYPPTISDAGVAEIVRTAATAIVGEANVMPFAGTMGAEDMSLVLQKVPGCYFFVGGGNEAIGAIYPHHHPKFNICESSLSIGARTLVEAVKACFAAG
jgi:amidohydrolase